MTWRNSLTGLSAGTSPFSSAVQTLLDADIADPVFGAVLFFFPIGRQAAFLNGVAQADDRLDSIFIDRVLQSSRLICPLR